jgi:predicted secreted acid phosphatase
VRKSKETCNCIPMGEKLTIAIDIDGTVADTSKLDFSKIDQDPDELLKATPIKGALEAVKKLYGEGHKIVFHSSRTRRCKKATEVWLKKHGFPFHHLEMRKFVAHVYIDDRAVNGCDWKQVMKQLQKQNLSGQIARKLGSI